MTSLSNSFNTCRIQDTSAEELAAYGTCGYRNYDKQKPLQLKIKWYQQQYDKGLRVKILVSSDKKSQGMIEYVPGKYAWRPVEASAYMFIHCLFVGFKKEYKGRGYASLLIQECIGEAKVARLKGVAVVTRKTSFMAGKEVFLKNGFHVVDKAPPDFELLAYKFIEKTDDPQFILHKNSIEPYRQGLYILRADQCPYSLKNVEEITAVAGEYGLHAEVVNLKSHLDAQQSPCAYGTFCIILNGDIVSYHPISSTRFRNILNQKLK